MRRQKSFRQIEELLLSSLGPSHWWPGDSPFEVMVGAILTQNTSWKNVEKAIASLKRHHALSPQAIAEMKPEQLAEMIRSSGYYNQKARKLRNLVQWF